ncbi:hypothetical protein MBEBAB_2613 [Brevundimonas abyssalis TAR-001]|uniref:Uncharacterized protein n=1 Tax=Brevundimonas abyssalis TAR-001 TaxID=1391729 RepID=A0A8E0NDE9_9CAUL|nr:hypothetical protein MBEBAB_2613 [Brevundimonas abyssalis TAR-001]
MRQRTRAAAISDQQDEAGFDPQSRAAVDFRQTHPHRPLRGRHIAGHPPAQIDSSKAAPRSWQ